MDIKTLKSDGKPLFYDPAFKRKICLEYLSGTLSLTPLGKKYNIGGSGTIKAWVNKYQQEQHLLKLQSMVTDPPESNDSQEYQKLQKQLKEAELKILALETMIDIAEDEFAIEIRKKPGTKPSGN